jgi:type VI secretion system secreted protein VgrG
MTITTPLGPDDLLLIGYSGHEEISQLFVYDLDLLAEAATDIPFDKLLGQPVTVTQTLVSGKKRYFTGICKSISQGPRDATFIAYRMEMVPRFWLLSKRHQSRIFQQKTVPDILKQVLTELDVKYEIQGTFHPRDYCVQYRESDFNFASRLMEEEGIYYFFTHTDKSHTMVLANTPQSHPDMPEGKEIIWEDTTGGVRPEDRIHRWEKTQELRSGKYTLWDSCFELPDKHLEAEQPIDAEVSVGKVKHKLKLPVADPLEIYDFPGEYAQRFDGSGRRRPGWRSAEDIRRQQADRRHPDATGNASGSGHPG